jgi:hypothetical protein
MKTFQQYGHFLRPPEGRPFIGHLHETATSMDKGSPSSVRLPRGRGTTGMPRRTYG